MTSSTIVVFLLTYFCIGHVSTLGLLPGMPAGFGVPGSGYPNRQAWGVPSSGGSRYEPLPPSSHDQPPAEVPPPPPRDLPPTELPPPPPPTRPPPPPPQPTFPPTVRFQPEEPKQKTFDPPVAVPPQDAGSRYEPLPSSPQDRPPAEVPPPPPQDLPPTEKPPPTQPGQDPFQPPREEDKPTIPWPPLPKNKPVPPHIPEIPDTSVPEGQGGDSFQSHGPVLTEVPEENLRPDHNQGPPDIPEPHQPAHVPRPYQPPPPPPAPQPTIRTARPPVPPRGKPPHGDVFGRKKLVSGPLACCQRAGQFIADSLSLCHYWRCENSFHHIGLHARKQKCAGGTYVNPGYRRNVINPCTNIFPSVSFSCTRRGGPNFVRYCPWKPDPKEPACYSCSVQLTGYNDPFTRGGFSQCALKDWRNDEKHLDRQYCEGAKCFERLSYTTDKDGNKITWLSRGCASAWSLGDQIDTTKDCELQNGERYRFCDGHLCNDQDDEICSWV